MYLVLILRDFEAAIDELSRSEKALGDSQKYIPMKHADKYAPLTTIDEEKGEMYGCTLYIRLMVNWSRETNNCRLAGSSTTFRNALLSH